ncbi:MAG TPA: SH3 domain-containing protein [Candidatus Krumholzibacteria bacterium]
METIVEEITQLVTKSAASGETPNRNEEIEELLRIKQARRIEDGRVPCPSCGVTVDQTLNRCPFCESDIAAATALARETMRRLKELSGSIDAEHASRTRETPKPRGFFERLKCLFQGDPAPVPVNTFKADPNAARVLGNLAPGDAIRVIGEDGPWLQVKTPSSEIAWVYSTFKKSV